MFVHVSRKDETEEGRGGGFMMGQGTQGSRGSRTKGTIGGLRLGIVKGHLFYLGDGEVQTQWEWGAGLGTLRVSPLQFQWKRGQGHL